MPYIYCITPIVFEKNDFTLSGTSDESYGLIESSSSRSISIALFPRLIACLFMRAVAVVEDEDALSIKKIFFYYYLLLGIS